MKDPVGSALLKAEFTATTVWPGEQMTLDGIVDMEANYKSDLAGKMVSVMEIGIDGSYLVYRYGEKSGPFIWLIEKEDVIGYIPLIKKNGTVMPGGMSPTEEFEFMIKNFKG